MVRLQCAICSDDIESFYDTSLNVIELNATMLLKALNHSFGAKYMTPGRVIVLRDGVSTSQCNCCD